MLNQCQFIGNLGADPEIRRTQAGNPIANLRVAVSKKWRDSQTGERKEKTTWVPVVIFSEGLAKVAEQYLRKGSKVFISGEFSVRKWQSQDGQDRYATEIILQGPGSTLTMLDGKPSSDASKGGYSDGTYGSSQDTQSGYGGAPAGGAMDDEIPFQCEWRG